MRSMSIGALHGGKLAMKRLLQYQKMRATEKNQDQVLEKLEKMIKDCAPDFAKLQVKHLTLLYHLSEKYYILLTFNSFMHQMSCAIGCLFTFFMC